MQPTRSTDQDFRLGLESLETRTVLSASLLSDGTLLIIGSQQGDQITVAAQSGNGRVSLTGVPDVASGTVFDNVQRVRILGQQGNDVIRGQGNSRALDGTRLRFTILGGNGNDTIIGGPAADDLQGGNGGDSIFGRNGADFLRGGNAADLLSGQRGNDRLEGDNGRDALLGGPGNDALFGGNGNDLLRGGAGDDDLVGGNGEDDLFGGDGDDDLLGGAERDLLRGPIAEQNDFNSEDAFHSPLIGTANQGLVVLSDQFWMDVANQAGEGDLTGDSVRALDSLQLIRARVADERLEFDQEFAQLTPQRRAEAREAFGGIIDDFLDDIAGNPGDLTSARLLEFQLNARDEFPDEVRDEFDDYMEAMIELNDQVSDLGDAMDSLQGSGREGPFMTEFARLFEF